MKKNHNKYKLVDKLPFNALPVKQYADSKGISTAYIYKMIKQGNNTTFDIVIFKTINFIIPKN